MRKLITAAASFTLGAGLLLGVAPAAQAAQAGQTVKARSGTSGTTVSVPRTRSKVTYPKRIRRGGTAVYTWRVTNARWLDSETLVLTSYLPRGGYSFRFLQKPAHSTCGLYKKKWVAYCIVRLRGQNNFTMKYRLTWNYRYVGPYRVNHYWAPVDLGGGSAADYINEVTREYKLGTTKTTILR